MDEFDNIAKKATDLFYGALKKSGEFVENTKISLSISQEKEKITKVQNKMGAKIYRLYKDGEEYPEMFAEDIKAISGIEEKIAELEKELNERRAQSLCPECSAKLGQNIVYCPKCGTKQTTSE